MKRIYWTRGIKILSLVLVLTLFLALSQRYYFEDLGNNTTRLRGFYAEERESLDVVVLGASEVYSDFSADEFYKETGVTAYPYAYAANPVTFWTYELKEILSRQSPKLLLVEMNGVVYNDNMLYKEASVRYLADNMHLQREKWELTGCYGQDDRLSYFFPIIKYHSQWANLDKVKNAKSLLAMDLRGYSLLKGTFSHTAPKKIKPELTDYEADGEKALNPAAETYLREFLEACKDSGIEHVLFVRFPHLVTSQKSVDALHRYHRAARIVSEYGYEFVDLDAYCGQAGIERPADFHNTDHLLMGGQKKFTDFLGGYLTQKYDLRPTPLSEKQQKRWQRSTDYMDACFSYYEEYRKHPTEDDKFVIYERGDILKKLEPYLDSSGRL